MTPIELAMTATTAFNRDPDGADSDPWSLTDLNILAREVLRLHERCEKLEAVRRLLDHLSYDINSYVNEDSADGPEHWKVSRADFPELFDPNRASEAMWMPHAIQAALDLTAAVDAGEGGW